MAQYMKIWPYQMPDLKNKMHEVHFHVRYRDEYRHPIKVGQFITTAPKVEVLSIMPVLNGYPPGTISGDFLEFRGLAPADVVLFQGMKDVLVKLNQHQKSIYEN